MDPDENVYTLAELADVEDVTPRTIRYYIAQGLLPPPVGGGPTTRYTRGHLLRLRLIRDLQRQHLPLAEIRARVEHLSYDEVATLVEAAARRPAGPAAGSAMDYIRSVLTPPPPTPPAARVALPVPSPAGPVPPLPDLAPAAPPRSVREDAAPYPEPPPSRGTPSRSQWDRVALAPDIELHVRRPLSRHQNRAVEKLIGLARQLLEEDPS